VSRYSLTACPLASVIGLAVTHGCGSVCLGAILAITGGLVTAVNDDAEAGLQSSARHGPPVNVGDSLLRVASSTSVWLLFLITVPVVGVY